MNLSLITALIRSFTLCPAVTFKNSSHHSISLPHATLCVFLFKVNVECIYLLFNLSVFTDHKSHYFTELIFPGKQNSFSISHINQSFNFTFLHTITDYQYQYLLTYQTFITTQQVVFPNLPIDKEDPFLYTQFSTHHLPLSLVN